MCPLRPPTPVASSRPPTRSGAAALPALGLPPGRPRGPQAPERGAHGAAGPMGLTPGPEEEEPARELREGKRRGDGIPIPSSPRPGAQMQTTPLVSGQGNPTPGLGHGREGERQEKRTRGTAPASSPRGPVPRPQTDGAPRASHSPTRQRLRLRHRGGRWDRNRSSAPPITAPPPRPAPPMSPPREPGRARGFARSRFEFFWLNLIESFLVYPQQMLGKRKGAREKAGKAKHTLLKLTPALYRPCPRREGRAGTPDAPGAIFSAGGQVSV